MWVVIILLVLLCVGTLPHYSYSQGFGYYPSGGLGLILLCVVLWMLFGGRL